MTLTAPERADIAEAAEKLDEFYQYRHWQGVRCNYCAAQVEYPNDHLPIPHTPSCLVTKLRAIVAREKP